MDMVAETLARSDGPMLDATPSIRTARASSGIALINRQILILFGRNPGNRPGQLSSNSDAKPGLIG